MKNLFKQMKNHIVAILLIVVFLVAQAQMNLTLPKYTSNIVNIGIQQSGIVDTIPTAVTKNTYDDISLLATADAMEVIRGSYLLVSKATLDKSEYEKLVKKYPILKKDDIYILDNLDEKKLLEIETNLKVPFTMSIFLKQENNAMVIEVSKVLKETMGPAYKEELGLLGNMKLLPKEAVDEFVKTLLAKIGEVLTDVLIDRATSLGVKMEYELLKVDTNKIQTTYILTTGLRMLGVTLVSVFAALVVTFIGSRVAAMVGSSLRTKVFSKVISLSTAEIKRFSTSTLITRTTNDIMQVQDLIVMSLRVIIYTPIMGIGAFLKVMETNTNMTWIIGLVVAILVVIMGVLFILLIPKFEISKIMLDKLNLVSREGLTGREVIRAFSTQKYEEERFESENTKIMKLNKFIGGIMSTLFPFLMFMMSSVTILIVWGSAIGINDGIMQGGDMMAFIQYSIQIIMSFIMITVMSIMIPNAIASMKRVSEVINSESLIKELEEPHKFDIKKRGIVEFKDVSFQYPDADSPVLTGISFTACPGETTAIIGSTGSGKSTVINLIPRLFDVTTGQILVHGTDVKKASISNLRKSIGYVPQKGLLFKGTIESNVKYGNPDLDDIGMQEALSISQSSEFVERLDEGIHSPIVQGGKNVSGGQRQRLSIARAIAINPDILIFDDSFSALDLKTDKNLREALKEITADKTVIVVAQRISTIIDADKIIVMNEGKVNGIGTHEELLRNNEIYREIASSQLTKEELNGK